MAAEVAVPVPVTTPVSGFERTAAALLSPQHVSETRPDTNSSKASEPPHATNLLTEDMDLLIDQELETLTAEQYSSTSLSADGPLSSFVPPPVPQQPLPELLQSSLMAGNRERCTEQSSPARGSLEHFPGTTSLSQLSKWEDEVPERQKDVLDFSHLMAETSPDKPKLPLDLAASGRPSAFQVYKKQGPTQAPSESTEHSETTVSGARSKVYSSNCNPHGYVSSTWNLEAPVFSPHIHGNQGPSFITPVAQPPSAWLGQTRHPFPWLNQVPVPQAPLKHSTAVSRCWAQPAPPQPPAHFSRLRLQGKVLVLLRGAPGSGKSTLARLKGFCSLRV